MQYDIQVAMTISKFAIDPQEISEALAVVPARIALRGSRDPVTVVPRSNIWSLRSTPPAADASLDDHWAEITSKLTGKEHTIAEFASHADVVFTIIVGPGGKRPALVFGRDVIAFVAACGGRLEID